MFVLIKLIQMEDNRNNISEIPLQTEKEFKNYLEDNRILYIFEGVFKFKSVKRAIRRGHIDIYGKIFPKRPFSNSGNKSKRVNKHSKKLNEDKKSIYEKLTK